MFFILAGHTVKHISKSKNNFSYINTPLNSYFSSSAYFFKTLSLFVAAFLICVIRNIQPVNFVHIIGKQKDLMQRCLKFNKRGFSLVELVTTVAVLSVLSVFSITQYKKHTTRSRIKEAKIQLGQLNSMQNLYFMENRTYTFQLKGNMFPKGRLLYNVGFSSSQTDHFADPGCSSTMLQNNYYELCGDDVTPPPINPAPPRKECSFKKRPTNTFLKQIYHSEYSGSNTCDKTPSAVCTDKRDATAKKDRSYKKYVAYAVGDILSPYEFSTTDHKELDTWRINSRGVLQHCNDPLEKPLHCNKTINECCDQEMANTPAKCTNSRPSGNCVVNPDGTGCNASGGASCIYTSHEKYCD